MSKIEPPPPIMPLHEDYIGGKHKLPLMSQLVKVKMNINHPQRGGGLGKPISSAPLLLCKLKIGSIELVLFPCMLAPHENS